MISGRLTQRCILFPKIILKNETQLRDWWEDPNPEAPRVVVAPCFMKKVETTTGEEFDYTNPKISMNQNGEKTHQIIRLAEVYCWYAEAVGRSKQAVSRKLSTY